jgi:predicted aminopeptidase
VEQPRRRRRLLGATRQAGFIVALSLALSACSAGYLLRAGVEEAKILWRRQPIEEVLRQNGLDDETRAKLELVLDVRRFARDTLDLRVGGSYGSLARVDADQVVHVVSAAYPLRLESYTWWFPIVGSVPYKGFFSQDAAEREAVSLRRDGLDTYVRPSVAFSTLGWFDDPLLTTMLRSDEIGLTSTVLHELTHNTLYLAGQARFNESFASFVGYRGAVLYYTSVGDAEARAAAARRWDDAVLYSEFLGRLFERLEAAYAGGADLKDRERLFDAARAEFAALPWANEPRRRFGTPVLNNAILLQERLYADRLAVFERLQRQYGGDLQLTVTQIRERVTGAEGDPFALVHGLLQPR